MFEEILDSYKRACSALNMNIDKDNSEQHIAEAKSLYDALFVKWEHKIPKKWYGFDIPLYVPIVWFFVVDDILDKLDEKYPEFEIHQIKLKFGGMRFYIGNIPDEIDIELSKVENVLFNKNLIY